MNEHISHPLISQALLNDLNETFPDTLPPFGRAFDEICYLQGTRAVVDYLQLLFNNQFERE